MVDHLILKGSSQQSRQQGQQASSDQYQQETSGIWIPKTLRPQEPEKPQQDQGTKGSRASGLSAPNDPERWRRHWKERGWPWRREPEISLTRQQELTQRRETPVDIQQGIYPFKDMILTRADIEWLLVTHEGGRGPVDWSDESQRERKGLDLRGARVEEMMDLSALPLAKVRGGLSLSELMGTTEVQREQAGLTVSQTNFRNTMLNGADLSGAKLSDTDLTDTELSDANLISATLDGAWFIGATLNGADLMGAKLNGANFDSARLDGANLMDAELSGADLSSAKLNGANLEGITLANLKGIGPVLKDVQWGVTILIVVDWSQLQMLGDEYSARQNVTSNGKKKGQKTRRNEYQNASRANHQLAVILQDQGLTDEAARFTYRAKRLKRTVL
jgi:uncharacterized protein YjbI with pentapeptide repeats